MSSAWRDCGRAATSRSWRPPYGEGNARVAEVLVAEGDVVTQGTTVARMDNQAHLEGAILLAEANLAVRQATFVHSRAAIENSRKEALVGLSQARSAAAEAAANLARVDKLSERLTSQVARDAATAAADRLPQPSKRQRRRSPAMPLPI